MVVATETQAHMVSKWAVCILVECFLVIDGSWLDSVKVFNIFYLLEEEQMHRIIDIKKR